MNRSKAAFFNMISAVFYQVVASCGGLIIPGFILLRYGATIHGYSTTVSNVLVYVSLVTAGLAPAAIQAFYEPLKEKDNAQISCVFNTVSKFYQKAGMLYFGALILAGGVLYFVLIDQLNVLYIWGILFAVGLNGVLECLTYSRCRVILLADQRLYIVTFVDCFVYIIRIIIQYVLISFGKSIIVVMIIPLVLLPIRVLCLSIAVRRRYTIDNRVKTNNELLNKRYSAFVHQISSLIVLNTDAILLTLFGTLVDVSIYSVYNIVFASLYSLLTNMFKNGTVAIFGNLLLGESKQLEKVYGKFEYIYYMVVSIIYSCCAVLIIPFVRIYTMGQKIQYDKWIIAILFCVIGVVNNIRVPADTVITAAGQFKETQYRAILEATINLAASLILIKPLGIVGILVGTICSFLYRSTDIVIYSYKRIMKGNIKMAIKRIVRMIIIILINAFICSSLLKECLIVSWVDWFLIASLVFVGVSIITICINFVLEPDLFIGIIRQYFLKAFKKS